MGACCVTPPDTFIGVGTSHVVETVNIEMYIFNKATAALLQSVPLDTFFGVPIGPTSTWFITDPKVFFDASSGHWYLALVGASSGDNIGAMWLAASSTSDPTGSWIRWRFTTPLSVANSPPGTVGGRAIFPDYTQLGFTSDKIIVTGNGFELLANGMFNNVYQGAQIWVINKSDLVSGATPRNSFFQTGFFTMQPAQNLTANARGFLASTGTTSLSYWTVDGLPPASVTLSAATTLAVASNGVPPSAAQPGTATLIDTGDQRLTQAIWSNGSLWVAGNTSCTPTGDVALRSCARYTLVNTAGTPAVVQLFNLGAANSYYYYPAIMLDGSGSLVSVVNRSSAAEYPSVLATGRTALDPANTLTSPQLLKAGAGAYICVCGQNRWGDYSGAALDPTDVASIWLAGEYAKAAVVPACVGCTVNDDWGTWIARVKLPAIVGAGTYEDTSPAVAFAGSWVSWSDPGNSGGSARYSNDPAASAGLLFSGSSLTLVYVKQWNGGIATVTIDGAVVDQLDTYAATRLFQQQKSYSVAAGAHTVSVAVSGNKNAASSGTYLIFDAFKVQ